jgi:putative NADH-flavin reductase
VSRIVVLGAGGDAGPLITAEAASQGPGVTAVVRRAAPELTLMSAPSSFEHACSQPLRIRAK